MAGWVVLGLVLVIGGWLALSYNRLVRLRNRVEESWAQIDVQLRRRHDLIPNLVETVRGYAAHEREVLTQVTEARAAAVGAGGVADQAQAEAGLTRALRSLFAVAESYPDLKANVNFLELQEELTATEDKVSFARQFYNTAVRDYDTAREVFPTNIVAGLFNFGEREYFEVDDPDARDPVKVEF
ncbi:MAG TPA: LemA family protein [Nitriliruptorales bacterium]